jgi:hypothetical protein
MDELDTALLEAWNRLSQRVRDDRLEARRRAGRRLRKTFSMPPRAWCLAIRANDARISAWNCLVEPFDKCIPRRLPHTITLEGPFLQRLCAPVHIPWPGVAWRRAADMLGRPHETIRYWIKIGRLKVNYEPARTHGYCGVKMPVVWSPSPLNPMADKGCAPDEVWGTMWQDLHTRIPSDMRVRVQRAPRPRATGQDRFGSWNFVCPGLLGMAAEQERPEAEDGERYAPPRASCGRHVRKLHLPLPVWGIGDGWGVDPLADALGTLQLPEAAGLGTAEHSESAPARRVASAVWACERCHRLARGSMLFASGWNHFVSSMTGGLLYGHEVERPWKPKARGKPWGARKNPRPAVKRERVRPLLEQGLIYRQIAERIGISCMAVCQHARFIYAEAGVRTRKEFLARARELAVAFHRSPEAPPPRARDA